MAATAVTLLSAGVQLDAATGAAVDCSALGSIRMQIDARASDTGGVDSLSVFYETGPTNAGPWRQIALEVMSAGTAGANLFTHGWGDGTRRTVLDGADNFLRVRWSARRRSGTLSFGVAGTGILSA